MGGRMLLLGVSSLIWMAGCGGSGPEVPQISGGPPEVPGGADPGDVAVIDGWVTTLADGDVEGAADYFAIPSVAENGPTLLRIDSREAAIAFNGSLPCGAELVHATSEGEFTAATFRLTERPGPGLCGTGTGTLARASFVIEDGEIVEWRRVGAGGERVPSRAS